MEIQTEDVLGDFRDCLGERNPDGLRHPKESSNRVKEECSRSTGRVQDPSVQRVGDDCLDNLVRQPVGRVVLPEPVPGLRRDHRVIKRLQHVVVDTRP